MSDTLEDGAATRLLEDWLTIWQSELAGLLMDREPQALVVRMGAHWASAALALAQAVPREPAGGPARPDAAAGAAPVAAAPDGGAGDAGRDAVIERLLARAELEGRVGGAPG